MGSKRKRKEEDSLPLTEIIKLLPGYDPYENSGNCWFDEDAAQKAIDFIQKFCRHVTGPLGGQLVKLELWQKAYFANLFGWKRPDGTRRYRETLIYIPRKNSKTTMAALAVLAILFCPAFSRAGDRYDAGGQIFSIAAELSQAQVCFDAVSRMIQTEPKLMQRTTEILKQSLTVRDCVFRAVTSSAAPTHGKSPSVVVNDELHVQKNPEATEGMETGMGTRLQPLMIHATTAAPIDPESICTRKYNFAKSVIDGSNQSGAARAFLPCVYEVSRDDDWTDEKVWAKANPNLGVSVSVDFLREQRDKALESPAYENEFKRLHLNIQTEQAVRLFQMHLWDAGETKLDDSALLGRRCFGGLDLSTVDDLSAFVLAFDDPDGGYTIRPWFFCPQRAITERNRKGIPYQAWVDHGLMIPSSTRSIDYGLIKQKILSLATLYKIDSVGYDPYNASQIVLELEREAAFPLIEFRHGMASMSPPTKAILRMLQDGKLRHDGHPVLRWNVANVAGKTDQHENVMPSKKDSAEKIDGVSAMTIAIGVAERRGVDLGPSIYEEHSTIYA